LKGKKIALFRYKKQSPYVINTIERIFEVEIRQFNKYLTIADISEMIKTAKQEGIDVIVGGINAVAIGNDEGIKSVICRANKDNINSSIEATQNILKAKYEESMQSQWIKEILKYTKRLIIKNKEKLEERAE